MNVSNSNVQKQWDIGQSVFCAIASARALLSAGSEDDIQPQAIIAMEGLGAGLLIEQDRISEGIDALKGGESRRLSQLMITVGLSNGGTARLMRESVACVASFVLAAACKTCFTDQETGSMLYDMMKLRRVLQSVPVSRTQIERAVGAISGFGHKIVPTELFDQVSSTIQARLAPGEMSGLFLRSTIREIAEILSWTFEALQDTNVKKITLEGHQTGVWLASILVWLLPNETTIVLGDKRLLGTTSSRLTVTLKQREDGGSWHIRKWYLETEISELFVGGTNNIPTPKHRSLPLSHVPLGSARVSLAATYQLSDKATEATGQMAAALVDIAFEHGTFWRFGNYSESAIQVPFRDVCQTSFISGYHTITKAFGWDLAPDYFKPSRSAIVTSFHNWIERISRRNSLTPWNNLPTTLADALLQFETEFFEDNGFQLLGGTLKEMNILEPLMHIAAEALYCSIFDHFPYERPFRPPTTASLGANSAILWRLLSGYADDETVNQLQEFRGEAVKSVLPGAPPFSSADLAVVGNGTVAYVAPLAQFSTSKRFCSAVSIVQGNLRWGEDKALFLRLRESDEAEVSPGPDRRRVNQVVEAFRGETYLGLEARSNVDKIEFQTLISPSDNTLTLVTYMKSPSFRDEPIAVSWYHSIDALVFARHINNHDMTVFGEKCLAQSWEEQKIFSSITWLRLGDPPGGREINRHITTTSSNECERFFEAGRMRKMPPMTRMYVRQSAPLIQCVKVALEFEEKHSWVIIA